MRYCMLSYLKNYATVLHQVSQPQDILVCYYVAWDSASPSHPCIAAHMNINEKYLPYKHIIGQVVLDVCIVEPAR